MASESGNLLELVMMVADGLDEGAVSALGVACHDVRVRPLELLPLAVGRRRPPRPPTRDTVR